MLGGNAKRGADFGRERDRLCLALMDPAALRKQRRVVIGPIRARQIKKSLPLGKALIRVGIRIEKNMEVVERRNELCVLRAQETIAKDVARHIADADTGKGGGLNVATELAEMALD